MLHIINNQSSAVSVAAYRVVQFFCKIGEAFASYKRHRNTYNTLSKLSNKDLNDIGISRSDIRSIANETWHGNQARDYLPYPHITKTNKNIKGWV